MFMRLTTSLLLLICLAMSQGSRGGGFGEHINWKSISGGIVSAKMSRKPVMVLIHEPHCPACHALQPKFSASKEIADLASKFEMVNVSEEPHDAKYAPDGSYVPRILFFGPDGEFKAQVVNPSGQPQYKYYHFDTPSIVSAMQAALT